MQTIFNYTPTELGKHLSKEEKDKRIVYVDLEITKEAENCIADITFIFNQITVLHGVFKKEDFYIATDGAECEFHVNKCRILSYTPSSTFEATYESSSVGKTKGSIKPKAKLGDPFSTTIEKVSEKATSKKVTFKGIESDLVAYGSDDFIRWIINFPHKENAVRDFFVGEKKLFAKFCTSNENIVGRISFKASSIKFYNSSRKQLNFQASLIFQYLLWKAGIKVVGYESSSINFEEI